jgi:hypothetical protein
MIFLKIVLQQKCSPSIAYYIKLISAYPLKVMNEVCYVNVFPFSDFVYKKSKISLCKRKDADLRLFQSWALGLTHGLNPISSRTPHIP